MGLEGVNSMSGASRLAGALSRVVYSVGIEAWDATLQMIGDLLKHFASIMAIHKTRREYLPRVSNPAGD